MSTASAPDPGDSARAAVVPGASDTDDSLQSLQRAASDPALPAETRDLLARAREALLAAQARAEAERQRYRNLFDAVPDPVSIIAEDGTVMDLNRAGMQAYRRPREEIVGKNINVLNPDLPRDHLVPVWETLNRGDTYVIEVTNMRGDGSRFRSRCIRPTSPSMDASASSRWRATSARAGKRKCAIAN